MLKALELLEVDEEGFDRVDNRILEAIIDNFSGEISRYRNLILFYRRRVGHYRGRV